MCKAPVGGRVGRIVFRNLLRMWRHGGRAFQFGVPRTESVGSRCSGASRSTLWQHGNTARDKKHLSREATRESRQCSPHHPIKHLYLVLPNTIHQASLLCPPRILFASSRPRLPSSPWPPFLLEHLCREMKGSPNVLQHQEPSKVKGSLTKSTTSKARVHCRGTSFWTRTNMKGSPLRMRKTCDIPKRFVWGGHPNRTSQPNVTTNTRRVPLSPSPPTVFTLVVFVVLMALRRRRSDDVCVNGSASFSTIGTCCGCGAAADCASSSSSARHPA